MKSENVGFAKATPPVAKNSHWPLAMPTRPQTVDNQWLLKDSVKGAEFRPNATSPETESPNPVYSKSPSTPSTSQGLN